MQQDSTPPVDEINLKRCQSPPPISVVTTVAPVGEYQSLYIAAADRLYAVNASDGTAHWCQQVKLTRELRYHPGMSYPPPPRMTFGTPRVVNGVVYVCASSYGGYTYAFNAGDGTLRWRTRTDGRIVSMPVVNNGIVYNGTYALNELDGTVLWRIAIDTQWISLNALVDDTLYATTQMGIYAINAQNGEAHCLYQPPAHTMMSGPPIVFDHLLYVGTSGSVDHPEKSCFSALDAETGIERWRYPMGSYIGSVIHNESIYVSLGDRFLYALDKNNGMLRWKYQFASSGYYPATIAENVLYINIDGAYALSSKDGVALWHQQLGSSPSVSFTPSVVLDGVVYVVRIDGHGQSVLYSLNASNGDEYWHTHYPSSIAPLAVAQ